MNPAYQAPQLLHGVNKVDAKALICSEFCKTNSCYQTIQIVMTLFMCRRCKLTPLTKHHSCCTVSTKWKSKPSSAQNSIRPTATTRYCAL